jgi:hypothetical protein
MSEPSIRPYILDSIEDWPPTLRPGALLLAMDATATSPSKLEEIATDCLEGPLAVFACWGPGSAAVKHLFDSVYVAMQTDGRRSDALEFISTSHADEPLKDALDMLRLQIASFQPQTPHAVVLVGKYPRSTLERGLSEAPRWHAD